MLVGFLACGVEGKHFLHKLQVLRRGQSQVEKDPSAAVDFAGAAARAAEPLEASLVPEAAGCLERLIEKIDGVHRTRPDRETGGR